MRVSLAALVLPLLLVAACGESRPDEAGTSDETVIAFGSCAQQDLPQPIWTAVMAARPDLFLFLGDNVYGDTEDMGVMRRRYEQLAAQPGFQQLREEVPIMATWDDHDYGEGDAGNWYPARDSSQAVFMDFWEIAPDAPMRSRPGVYSARTIGEPGRRVQVILLDTRYFRDRFGVHPDRTEAERELGFGPYAPTDDTTATMLGEAQWQWLRERLLEPAEVRIIGTSIQMLGEDHGWESWGEMPHERARLYDLIRETGAEGVIFVSGDTHWAEISADSRGPYVLYDITSSALNQTWPQAVNLPNRYRVSEAVYPYANFGLVSIDWRAGIVTLQIRDEMGWNVFGHGIRLRDLR